MSNRVDSLSENSSSGLAAEILEKSELRHFEAEVSVHQVELIPRSFPAEPHRADPLTCELLRRKLGAALESIGAQAWVTDEEGRHDR